MNRSYEKLQEAMKTIQDHLLEGAMRDQKPSSGGLSEVALDWLLYGKGFVPEFSSEDKEALRKLGCSMDYYITGSAEVVEEGSCIGGLRHGVWRRYSSYDWSIGEVEKYVREETTYARGKKNGTDKGWHSNGKLWYEGEYVENTKHGKWLFYSEDGTKKRESNYYLGLEHGYYKIYNEDGTLQEETEYHNNLKHGYSYTFDSAENMMHYTKYHNGRKTKSGSYPIND